MSRATQFTVAIAVAGVLVLGGGSARPQPPSYGTFGPSPATIAQAETRERARALGPGFCFAGRPCPGATAAVCFAGATALGKPTAGAKALPCPKPAVSYRFADSPPGERR